MNSEPEKKIELSEQERKKIDQVLELPQESEHQSSSEDVAVEPNKLITKDQFTLFDIRIMDQVPLK